MRVPADPIAALGVATKQFVEAQVLSDIGLIAKVSASTTSSTNSDVVNITTAGRVGGVHLHTGGSAAVNGKVTVTIDSITDGEFSTSVASSTAHNIDRALGSSGSSLRIVTSDGGMDELNIFFKTSLRVQHRSANNSDTVTTRILYERKT